MPLSARQGAARIVLVLALAPSAASRAETEALRRSVAAIMASPDRTENAGPRILSPRFVSPRARLAPGAASSGATSAPAQAIRTAGGPAAPQTPGANFLGAALSDSDAFPPDTAGAPGPTQFLVGVNGRIRSFAKATGLPDGVLDASLDSFFSSVRNGNPTATPQVRFDRLSGRWIVTANNFGASLSTNRILIAVTDAASNGVISNSTVWTFFFFQHNLVPPAGDSGFFFDSPSLGVDANALTIGGNLFDVSGVFQGSTVHVVRKSAIMGAIGGDLVPANVTAFRNLTGTPGGAGPYAPRGVDALHDAAATTSWIAGVDNAGFGTLVFRSISFASTGSWPPSGISANLALSVSATSIPLTVPHLGNLFGTDGELDAVDDRLFAASRRGGRLWTAQNISVDSTGASPGNRNGSRWYEIDVTGAPALTVAQSGTLFDPAASNPRFYWMPSIAVSGQGHVAIGTSSAGAAERINAATAGRLAGDPTGTLQAPVLYTSSSASYNPAGDPGPARRWGDYSFTSVDPNDDMTMWTIQEYCDATDSWGVRVVELVAPPPATPSAAAPNVASAGQTSVLVDVTGTSSAGSGFFDPGAGFPGRLHASVSGGVTVNAVTYTDPTSITLDLNTTGASNGPVVVTITNPDGQSVSTGTGFVTIGPLGPVPIVDAITPTSGPSSGGTAVTLTGTDFLSGASVTIGGVPATGVVVTPGTTADGTIPALVAGKLHDVALRNADNQSATLLGGWFADFLDVPQGDNFLDYVEKLIRNGITAGCGGGYYCRNASTTRAQMAVFLLKSKLGSGYSPPACTGHVFTDVPCTGGIFDPWIEDLADRGITAGCGGGLYCPASPVTRAQMAVFLLKTDLGSNHTPPACAGNVFDDVPCTGGIFDPWIEDLADRGITAGCSGSPALYCPGSPTTRGQMAVFLVKTFGLP